MRTNSNSNQRHRRGLGLRRPKSPENNQTARSQPVRATYGATKRASGAAQEFDPNPEITASPSSNTPPKKIWEGAYRNFLGRGTTRSPSSTDTSPHARHPSVERDESPIRRPSFSTLPGSKRLVARTTVPPSSAPSESFRRSTLDTARLQSIPAIPTLTGGNSSMGANAGQISHVEGVDNEGAIRGGKFFQSMFSRSTSDGWVARRHRKNEKSVSGDELDAALRNGVDKGGASPNFLPDSNPPPPPFDTGLPIEEQESTAGDGLDALLAQASAQVGTSPHFTVSMGRASSLQLFPSYGGISPKVQPDRIAGSRSSSMGQIVVANESQHGTSSVGSMLASDLPQQVEDDAYRSGVDSSGQIQPKQPLVRPSGHSDSQNPPPVSLLSQQLHPRPDVKMTTESIAPSTDLPKPDSDLKKAFTNFHNKAAFGSDATSAFLGEESSTMFANDRYLAFPSLVASSVSGSSFQQQLLKEGNRPWPAMTMSTSLPVETLDEQNISIHKDMRLLKPVEGTGVWQKGRRYLISAAAMAACPLAVLNKISASGSTQVLEASNNVSFFGAIDLGECLLTYVGDKHHLSLGRWSSCRLILRQNYLLEYECSSSIAGPPRGFCHLQLAQAYPHDQFHDALELKFYASPCAKGDLRVLMIRIQDHEKRDAFVECLNRAANLRIEDLWDFDKDHEFGRGRYASIFRARRRDLKHERDSANVDSKPRTQGVEREFDCALKIVDKNQFWRRVVKGKERADTLVRELAVQATLAAKCAKTPTFLLLRGCFETSDNVVMELELLEGRDLFDYISSKEVLNENEAATIIRDILTSLEAMHRVGLAHRDVKPANLMMCTPGDEEAAAKLGDFGMSTFVDVDGKIRGRCGTPGYVAPEMLIETARNGYCTKVDVFSAGVTLYVMLCGYEPFYGESEKDLIEANRQAVIDFPPSDWGKISDSAIDLIKQMTETSPAARITARQALQHNWVTTMAKPVDRSNTSAVDIETQAIDTCTLS